MFASFCGRGPPVTEAPGLRRSGASCNDATLEPFGLSMQEGCRSVDLLPPDCPLHRARLAGKGKGGGDAAYAPGRISYAGASTGSSA